MVMGLQMMINVMMARLSDCARCGFVHYILWSSKKRHKGGTISVSVLQRRRSKPREMKSSPQVLRAGIRLQPCLLLATTPQSLSCVDETSDFLALGRAWNPRGNNALARSI